MREQTRKNNKTHGICIWNSNSECHACELRNQLHCHSQFKDTLYFGSSFFLAFIPAVLGILLSGFVFLTSVSIIVVWFLYILFFFCIWESKVLCSHCPYYANDNQKTLHCAINTGFIKISKYNPKPMSKSEKIQFIIGALIFILYPIPFLILAEQFIFLTIALIGIFIWMIIIQYKVCPVCINFSCPLNRVPNNIVINFLEKNPEIKKAWNQTKNENKLLKIYSSKKIKSQKT
jgi:hypothetical protein